MTTDYKQIIGGIEQKINKARRIYLFGAGRFLDHTIKMIEKLKSKDTTVEIVDNDEGKWGKKIDGMEVISPRECCRNLAENDVIFITNEYYKEIEKQLNSYGVDANAILSFQKYLDYCAAYKIEQYRNGRGKKSGRIRVGFATYEIESWDKIAPVFEFMLEDDRFEPFIIILPSSIFSDELMGLDDNEIIFGRMYPNIELITYMDKSGKKMDINSLRLDYLFLPAPYDTYVPDEFNSANLVNKVCLCYIPYGFNGAYNFIENNTIRSFFRNIYFDFSPTKEIHDILEEKFVHVRSVHQREMIGYPSFERYFYLEDRKKERWNVLWTPRWSYDNKIGGSHFFEYKEAIFALKEKFKTVNIKIRPHPMMFDHFIKQGYMSSGEVDEFKNEARKRNIEVDLNSDLFDTLKETDLLITDFSTIIFPFFLTTRPIVYCDSPNIELTETYKSLLDGIYIAENSQDIYYYVNNIVKDNDTLKGNRLKIKKKWEGVSVGSVERIINTILKDSE